MSIFVFSMYCKLRAHSTLNYTRNRPVRVIHEAIKRALERASISTNFMMRCVDSNSVL